MTTEMSKEMTTRMPLPRCPCLYFAMTRSESFTRSPLLFNTTLLMTHPAPLSTAVENVISFIVNDPTYFPRSDWSPRRSQWRDPMSRARCTRPNPPPSSPTYLPPPPLNIVKGLNIYPIKYML